ncbi:hypothetical protein JZ751_019752 [Albula glossodonta]|uniref:C2H2-type domain-containing protein n=1 Tax=Albula glossodonta TaxID=121402 RepID=A0A8T2MS56_9TELE|nr:hypothetical protein JZ751_019752 [Albula glossodonta]
MSLAGPGGGNAVETYDSGDEWDIGVGNLIIDLDADLEKEKLESGAMAVPPGAVATLPENIKLVSPTPPGRDSSKAKSKRSKNSKDSAKMVPGDLSTRREGQGRGLAEGAAAGGPGAGTGGTGVGKPLEKGGKARGVPTPKKDKEVGPGKSKKEKSEGVAVGVATSVAVGVAAVAVVEKEAGSQPGALGAPRSDPFEAAQNADSATEQLGSATGSGTGSGTMPLTAAKTKSEEPSHNDSQARTLSETQPEELNHTDGRALKKVKNEKVESPGCTAGQGVAGMTGGVASPCEQIMVRTRSIAVNTSDIALATEPECLGPCEPGTSVTLEGIVWQETEDGMLVVNVTWRNKTYVGTLLDCTRHDWAPPRFCESPSSDVELRNGRGRGRRARPNGSTPVNENSNSSDSKGSGKTRAGSGSKGRRGSQAAPPPGEEAKASPSPSAATKRKSTKPPSDMEPTSSSEDSKASKRPRPNPTPEPQVPVSDRDCPSPTLIDCPHPACGKKYRHANGLRYHQARAHSDLPDDSALLNGGSTPIRPCLSPARSLTPKGRGFDPQSPRSANKKRPCDREEGGAMEGDDGACLTDDASNDSVDERKCSKRPGGGAKLPHKSQKPVRPVALATPIAPVTPAQLYTLHTPPFTVASPGSTPAFTATMATMVQPIPNSPQVKAKTDPTLSPSPSPAPSPALSTSKDRKKKEKKRKEGEGPRAAAPLEPCDPPLSLLNGGADALQSRLASIKAEADKVYSFSDSAPSPSIGATGRGDPALAPPPGTPHTLTQNGSSPAYSDISDAGEEGGEGRGESGRSKAEDMTPRDGAKKALFPCHPPSKDPTYYPTYDTYYSPSYPQPSPGGEGSSLRVMREEEEEAGEAEERKVEPQEERKVEGGGAGGVASVIQQRPNVYMQPLYYNQYAYVPPYSYHADQAYHAHLVTTSPAYRQQCEERQRQGVERKARPPPTLSKAPIPSDQSKPPQPPPSKPKDPEPAKSHSIPKGEEPKLPSQHAEGLKGKLAEAGHQESKPSSIPDPVRPAAPDPATWYRQPEAESRLWPYVYPSKHPDTPRLPQDEGQRWREDKDREKERKGRDERPRPKDCAIKEEEKEGGDSQPAAAGAEDPRGGVAKEPRPPAHVQFAGVPQHQSYLPYVHTYPYGQYDPSQPAYRAIPSVMMQNYPGSYLPAGYSFPAYGGKMGEEGGEKSRSTPPPAGKPPPSEPKALDVLQQHASQYKSKSPSVSERDGERERPRSSPAQRLLPSPHLAYPLLSTQYDLSYSTGLSSSAIVASQQASAPAMYPPTRR